MSEATKEETFLLDKGYGIALEDFLITIHESFSLEDIRISFDILVCEHKATLKLHENI